MNELRNATTEAPGPIGELIDRVSDRHTTVLAVFSHPDDESLLVGGLLAGIARAGGRVIVASATAGEHGTEHPAEWPPHRLAERRAAELGAAVARLGGDESMLLGLTDGSCSSLDERLGTRLVGRLIEDVCPDLIVTFDDDGVTGHPDHQVVGQWTRRAAARHPEIPVLTTVAASAWPDACIERLHAIDAFMPGYPEATTTSAGVVATLDGDLLDRKLEALRCHESQMPRVADALGPAHFRALASIEAYRAANQTALRHLNTELGRTA